MSFLFRGDGSVVDHASARPLVENELAGLVNACAASSSDTESL